ncbi:MAG: hypothetical protein H0V94_05515, partial [Actinobacteria bacterium]|nr:hypothetical protein [Actinomycetota bacterium]
HLNDRPDDVTAASANAAPAVVAHRGGTTVLLLDPAQLGRVGGAFGSVLETVRIAAGLDWPDG